MTIWQKQAMWRIRTHCELVLKAEGKGDRYLGFYFSTVQYPVSMYVPLAESSQKLVYRCFSYHYVRILL